MILVILWRMTVPALSISFLVSPEVMQTFSAGWSSQPMSLAVVLMARGMLFRRVIRTPFASVWKKRSASSCPNVSLDALWNIRHLQSLVVVAPDLPYLDSY